jgi:heat shock protein HtpX
VTDTQVNVAARFARAVAESKRRAMLSVSTFILVLVVLGAVIGLVVGSLPAGVVAGLVFGVVLALSSYYRSDRIALARSSALVAEAADYPRYHNLVEGLCVAAGLPKPDLYVIDDSARNALAIGRDPKHASLAVTTGLLDDLNRIELEGVLACELSHVKIYDTLLWTVAVVPSMLLGPLGRFMMFRSTSPEHDLLADASGVQLTRYPPGLCSALKKLRADEAVVHHATRATARMWLESPLHREEGQKGSRFDRAFDTHPPLEERIRILEEM